MNQTRILKTGTLAVAVTIAFLVFVTAAEWSTAPATPTITCSAGTSSLGSVAVMKIIPQIAAGSFDAGLTEYTTVIQVVNISGARASISGSFYKENGTPLDNVVLTAGASNITTGTLDSTAIDKDGVLIISSGATGAGGAVGWGKITSCSGFSISTFLELRDRTTNALHSRVAIAASPANMSSFVIPRIRDVASGLDMAFALVNTAPSGTSAELTATLKDSSGRTVSGPKTITMAGGSHQALFTQQFFGLTNEAADGRKYHYVTFNSSSPSFAAIALAFEGGKQSSLPVDPLQSGGHSYSFTSISWWQ